MGALAKGSIQRPNIPNPHFPNRAQAASVQRAPAAMAPQAASVQRAPRAQRGVQYTPAARDEQANVEGGMFNIQNMARLKAEADAAKARSQYNRMAGQ